MILNSTLFFDGHLISLETSRVAHPVSDTDTIIYNALKARDINNHIPHYCPHSRVATAISHVIFLHTQVTHLLKEEYVEVRYF